jgi:hypothetical protein
VKLFRVFPYDLRAADVNTGGALFVPASNTLGRIANPTLYRELYFSESADGAISEVFGYLPVWTDVDFVHANGLLYHVSAYELDDAVRIFDLDNIAELAAIGISKPSAVVTRKRAITQGWARVIHELGVYAGARWWSYYCPEYVSFGLWDRAGLRHVGPPEPLTIAHPAVIEAARTIVRQVL